MLLSDHGVCLRKHADHDPAQAQQVCAEAVAPAAQVLAAGSAMVDT